MSAAPDQALRSLFRFADVVFALLFFRAIEYLPSFQGGRWARLPHGLLSLLSSQPAYAIRAKLTRPELNAAAEQFARAAALSWRGFLIWTLSWFILMPGFSLLLTRRRPANSATA